MSNNNIFLESFCNFMSETEGLSKEEIITDLEREGVNVAKLQQKVSETVKQCSEERRLSWRKHAITKQQLIDKLLKSRQSIIDSGNLKENIKAALSRSFGNGPFASAETYFRKIETLSDADLKTLAEDLLDLEILEDLESDDNK